MSTTVLPTTVSEEYNAIIADGEFSLPASTLLDKINALSLTLLSSGEIMDTGYEGVYSVPCEFSELSWQWPIESDSFSWPSGNLYDPIIRSLSCDPTCNFPDFSTSINMHTPRTFTPFKLMKSICHAAHSHSPLSLPLRQLRHPLLSYLSTLRQVVQSPGNITRILVLLLIP